MLNAAVSKNKIIREDLRDCGPHNRETNRTEIEMESILPIYTGVK